MAGGALLGPGVGRGEQVVAVERLSNLGDNGDEELEGEEGAEGAEIAAGEDAPVVAEDGSEAVETGSDDTDA